MKRWDVAQPADAAALPPSEALAAWLEQLRRLHGVPLGYLVPDEAMLGPETLRVAVLDPGWVDALCDGALSLRRAGPADRVLRAAAIPAGGAPVSGLLLRSQAVWRWPTLVVRALGPDEARLEPLREERLAPDVLLGLYAGELRAVELAEPAETLHFGFDEPPPLRDRRVLDIKHLRESIDAPTPADFAAALVQRAERYRLQREP
jgi:hypothetical protein